MEQTKPFFSPEMCQKLSSLAPGFEGHWAYVESLMDGKKQIICAFKRYSWRWANDYKFICPAWQVEDVLRNWSKIVAAVKKNPLPEDHINKYGRGADVIVLNLIQGGDTAYQKIEEYLWTILK